MDLDANLTCSSAIHRQGSYKLVESDEQWQAVQQHRGGGTQHRQHRGEQYLQQQQHYQHEVGSQVGGGHVSRRASGYVNSGAETETEMGVGTSSMRRNRRRQRWVQ